jgi:predicted PurR-regulated permease PerM
MRHAADGACASAAAHPPKRMIRSSASDDAVMARRREHAGTMPVIQVQPPTAAVSKNGPEAPAQKVEVVVSTPTVIKALAIFFGVILVFIARDALLSIVLSAVIVLGLDPPVAALERRGWGRGKAGLLLFALIGLAVFVIVVWAATPVWQSIEKFLDQLPAYVNEARNSDLLSGIDKNSDVFEKLEAALVDAARNLPESAINLLGAAAGALGSVFQLVTLTFLTLFGLIAKPQLIHSARQLMRPAPGARFERTFDEVTHTISFSLLGNIIISVIAGTVVGITAVIIDAPSPMVLALIVGLFDLIPQIGSAIAAFIVCIITLIASGLAPALILLAVILVYQQAENYLIQPAVMRQVVELSGFATIASVMVGGALLGVVGAILAVPVAASAKVVIREATQGRRERIAALQEAEAAGVVRPG